MRKPVVDYRKFSFKKLNTPEFSHLFLLLGWLVYFSLYFITESLYPNNYGTAIYSALDYKIPFCEWFVIPYVGWYVLIVGSLLYFVLYNVQNFKRLQVFIIVCQVVAMIIYIVFPNYQPLRLGEYPRDNILTDFVALIQTADTNSNVCPSLHVAISIGISSIWLKEESAKAWFKVFIVIFSVLVCLSTVFIKQHSVVDGYAAIALSVLAEYISCRTYWKEKIKRNK